MPVPLEPAQVREFAHGLTEVIVVEEKNPTLERLVRDALYDWNERPRVVGRRDDQGRPLIPAGGILDAERLITPLRGPPRGPPRRPSRAAASAGRRTVADRRCRSSGRRSSAAGARTTPAPGSSPARWSAAASAATPWSALMEAERVGDLVGLTCMGNEGAQWIGMAPFLERKHLVQNLGDGTFFHSGSLAIRAAVASGVDITYKLLYNGTVAMTGGQDAVGAVGVPEIAQDGAARRRQQGDRHHRRPRPLRRRPVPRGRRRVAPHPPRRGAEGARRDPGHDGADPRPGVRGREPAGPQPRQARHARLPGRHQRAGLRGLRRLRRQEQLPLGATGRHAVRSQDPHRPDELQLRLLVHGGRLPGVRHGVDRRRRSEAQPARRPARSTSAISRSRRRSSIPARFTVRLSGIGGTGVVTVSQILGTAAMLAGHTVRGLDQTGLSQKAGPVTSDIRITDEHVGGVEPRQRVGRRRAAGVRPAGRRQRLAPRAAPRPTAPSSSPTPTPSRPARWSPIPPPRYPAFDSLRERLDRVSRSELNR